MTVNELMKQKDMSKNRLSQNSGIHYTTINDICNSKAKLQKCSAETVYKISKALGVSMENLLEPCFVKRANFEIYKSNVCHRVKELGDVEFIIETLEKDDIRKYYQREWYPESFYLLAMLDYVSRSNDIPLCTGYDDLRCCRLEEVIYPAGILAIVAVSKSEQVKMQSRQKAIPEFMRFNIVESEVRDVI